jgi:hypothetical protein
MVARSGASDIMTSDVPLRLTIAAAVVLYGAAERRRFTRGPDAVARALSTGALALSLAHAAVAFDARYAWSHAAAYAGTAQQLDRAIGVRWGGGLYLNYAFYAIWCVDLGWWWMNRPSYLARPRAVDHIVSGVLFFIFLNGAVIFASGPVRILGSVVMLIVGLSWYARARSRPRHA